MLGNYISRERLSIGPAQHDDGHILGLWVPIRYPLAMCATDHSKCGYKAL